MDRSPITNFIIKYLVNGVVVTMLLMSFTNISFGTALIAASILTVIAYFIGDQLILRSTNNTVATLADGVLAFLYLYLLEMSYNWGLSLGEILIISVVLGIAEAFLHRLVFQAKATR